MEKYYLYFGSGGGRWMQYDTMLATLQARDDFAGRTHTSVKDWHIEQKFQGYWFNIL